TGEAGLNKSMLGEMDIQRLAQNILDFLVNYTNSNVGAFYLSRDDDEMELVSSYALDGNVKKLIKKNEGLQGQAEKDKKVIVLDKIKSGQFNITFTTGAITPENIIVIPILHENNLKGVIELGRLTSYNKNEVEFFNSISYQSGIAINTTQNRRR